MSTADAYAQLAWILATSPRAELRDGRESIELAKQAVQLKNMKDAFSFDALAAACAEAGDFTDAVQYADRATKLAKALGYEKYSRDIQKRLKLYIRRQPFRTKSESG